MKKRTSIEELTEQRLRELFRSSQCDHGGAISHCCYTGSRVSVDPERKTLEFSCSGTSEFTRGVYVNPEQNYSLRINGWEITSRTHCNDDNCVCVGVCPPTKDELLAALGPEALLDFLNQEVKELKRKITQRNRQIADLRRRLSEKVSRTRGQ